MESRSSCNSLLTLRIYPQFLLLCFDMSPFLAFCDLESNFQKTIKKHKKPFANELQAFEIFDNPMPLYVSVFQKWNS